jgi:hypothetical protein
MKESQGNLDLTPEQRLKILAWISIACIFLTILAGVTR